MAGLSGLTRIAARVRLGVTSFTSSMRFALSSPQKKDDPVTFPPGRA